jgi:hypothetical protein
MLVIGAVIVLVMAIVGVNLIRGSAAGDPAPVPPTPQPLLSETGARTSDREELRRHFLLKRPGPAR